MSKKKLIGLTLFLFIGCSTSKKNVKALEQKNGNPYQKPSRICKNNVSYFVFYTIKAASSNKAPLQMNQKEVSLKTNQALFTLLKNQLKAQKKDIIDFKSTARNSIFREMQAYDYGYYNNQIKALLEELNEIKTFNLNLNPEKINESYRKI